MKYPSNWPSGLYVVAAEHVDSPLSGAWDIIWRGRRRSERQVARVERYGRRYTVISEELGLSVIDLVTLEDALGELAQRWREQGRRAADTGLVPPPAAVEQTTTERKIPLTPEREAELAEAFDRYTDPNSPEYDPEFTRRMREETAKRGTQGSWFPDRH